MPELLAPIRAMGRRLGPRRRLILALACVLVVCGLIVVRMLSQEQWQGEHHYKQAAAEADRLDPHWRLDDILAQRKNIPDEVNSARLVRELAGKLPSGWSGIQPYRVSILRDREAPQARLSKESIKQLEDSLETASEFMPEARLLSGLSSGQLEQGRPRIRRLEQIGNLNALIDVNFPYGAEANRVIFLLWLDAQLRIEAGHIETALVDVRAMANAGRSVGDYPGLSAQMTRSGAFVQAIPCLETALAQAEARANALAPVQSLLEDEARHPHRMIALRGERAITDDLAEQIQAGKRSFREIPDFSEFPFIYRTFSNRINLRENQATVLEMNTRAVVIGQKPEAEQIAAMKALNEEWRVGAVKWSFMERNRRLTERLLMGNVTGIPTWLGMSDAIIRTAIAGLAAERFRLDRGRWPDSLEQLVPTYLSEIPRDPFVGAPLKLRKLPDGLFIYSVGVDGVDHGGTINAKSRHKNGADTGFRLWDVSARRQPAPAQSPGEALE
jgi:hypothetical protein